MCFVFGRVGRLRSRKLKGRVPNVEYATMCQEASGVSLDFHLISCTAFQKWTYSLGRDESLLPRYTHTQEAAGQHSIIAEY